MLQYSVDDIYNLADLLKRLTASAHAEVTTVLGSIQSRHPPIQWNLRGHR